MRRPRRVEATAPAPTGETARLDGLYRELESSLFALALVLRGEGFRVGGLRAMMASVLHDRRFPRQTFTDLHLGGAWLVSAALERGLTVSRQEVIEAMETAYWAYSWQPAQHTHPFGPKLS